MRMKKYELAIKKTYKEDNENLFKSKKKSRGKFLQLYVKHTVTEPSLARKSLRLANEC